LITDPKQYVDRIKSLGVLGKVVASDPRLDLALIELPRLPKSAEPLSLAATPAATGSSVLSVGASGVDLKDFSGTLWRLSSGDVRGRYEKDMTYGNGQRVRAMVLETQKPINPGDSGGPTANEDGELVGVVSSFKREDNAIMNDIDLTEVRGFLKGYASKNGWQWVDTSAAPPAKGPRPSRADRVASLPAALKTQKGADLVATLRQIAAHGPDARAAIPDLIRLLDDPNAAVQSAARAALEAVGDPGTAEEWAVTSALAGTAPQARRHALTLFAKGRTPTREQIPPLIKAADTGTDVDERVLAVRALGNVPAEAKPSVIPLLMAALDDDSPALAVAADAALTALLPYPKELAATFVESLTAPNPRLRRLAVRSLAPLAESVRQAAGWFVPRHRDADTQVKAQSLDALARWERDAGRTIPAEAVTACLAEKDPSVRIAAVRAIGRLGLSAAIPKLLPLLSEPGPAEFKTLLPDVLLSLESPSPETADELFTALFKQSPLAFPERTLRKLTESRRPLRAHLPAIALCLRDGKEPVRLAALAAMAEAKWDSEKWAGDIAAALGGSDAEVALALKSLTALGKAGAAQLASALRSDLPTTTRERVYIALGELAAVAPADCCEKLIADAEKYPKSADLIARAVASFAPAIPLARLKEIAYSENVGRKLERKSFYPVPYQVWALETVGLLDIQKFEVPEQKKVRDWLFNKKHYDRDPSCQDAAARSLAAVERKMASVPEKK